MRTDLFWPADSRQTEKPLASGRDRFAAGAEQIVKQIQCADRSLRRSQRLTLRLSQRLTLRLSQRLTLQEPMVFLNDETASLTWHRRRYDDFFEKAPQAVVTP